MVEAHDKGVSYLAKNDLEIVMLDLDELTPYEGNARKHTEADVQTIKNSIKQFGMCDPIGIWGSSNIIVEGHGRLLALRELGHTKAPCIRLDHLDDEQRRAYALAHNKTAEMSGWDFAMLDAEMADLADRFNMTDFGFAEHEEVDIDSFFEDAEPKEKEPKRIQCPHCGEWFEV